MLKLPCLCLKMPEDTRKSTLLGWIFYIYIIACSLAGFFSAYFSNANRFLYTFSSHYYFGSELGIGASLNTLGVKYIGNDLMLQLNVKVGRRVQINSNINNILCLIVERYSVRYLYCYRFWY